MLKEVGHFLLGGVFVDIEVPRGFEVVFGFEGFGTSARIARDGALERGIEGEGRTAATAEVKGWWFNALGPSPAENSGALGAAGWRPACGSSERRGLCNACVEAV